MASYKYRYRAVSKAKRDAIRATERVYIDTKIDALETQLNSVAAGIELPEPTEERYLGGDAFEHHAQRFGLDIQRAAANIAADNVMRVAGAIAAVVPEFMRKQIDVWPVRTGKSLGGFEIVIPQNSGRIEVIVKNNVKYAYMLTWGRQNPDTPPGQDGKSAWATLFRSQAMNLSKRIHDVYAYKHPRRHYDLWYRQRQKKAGLK